MNTFDLQIQSTASDGKHTPREIVGMARDLKLPVIALTDHDTVSGVEEALAASREYGVGVIPGIEMSVEDYGSHILGFGVDYHDKILLDELEKFKQGRIDGAKKMVENLRAAGFAIEWDDVLRQSTGAVIARPHIARAILNRAENKAKLQGIATSHDFILKYLTDESPYYARRAHISAKDAIALIHEARGVAVWSHPVIHFRDDYEALEKFLQQLLGWGMDGLEIFNPSHSEDDAEFIESMSVKYGMLRTAGSDFHEKKSHARDDKGMHSADTLGDYETYGFATDDILPKLDEAMQKRAVAIK